MPARVGRTRAGEDGRIRPVGGAQGRVGRVESRSVSMHARGIGPVTRYTREYSTNDANKGLLHPLRGGTDPRGPPAQSPEEPRDWRDRRRTRPAERSVEDPQA